MRISDWSSDVCSSDLAAVAAELFVWPRHAVGGIAVVGQGHGRQFRRSAENRGAARPRQRPGRAGQVEVSRLGPVARPIAHTGLPQPQVTAFFEIGRASCRERVCQYVWISVVDVSLKKNITKNDRHINTRISDA